MPVAILGPAKVVLIVLADHADDTGECWPSMTRMTLFTGLGERTVRNAIRDLEKLTIISTAPSRGRSTNTYKLAIERSFTFTPERKKRPTNPALHAGLNGTSTRHLPPVNPAPPAANPASHTVNPAPPAPKPLEPSLTINEPPTPATTAAVPDARTMLFRDGLMTLMHLTGKPAAPSRALIGKWLRDAKDDCSRLHKEISQAAEDRRADPVGWITAALKTSIVQSSPLDTADEFGVAAWVGRQDIKMGDVKGKSVACINGWGVEAICDQIVEAIQGGGGRINTRPNWDAVAGWCREDVPYRDGWLGTISRIAGKLPDQVHSMAVFDAALRNVSRRVSP